MITSAWAAAGVAFGLALAPFGPLGKHLQGSHAWHGMDEQGPVFLLVRAERVWGGTTSCSGWTHALERYRVGGSEGRRFEFSPLLAQGDPARFQAWAPWRSDDSDDVEGCNRSPCKVKLDRAEAEELGRTSKKQRYQAYLTFVTRRAERYLHHHERPGYEHGKSVDPWEILDERGFRTLGIAPPSKAELWQRRMDFKVAPMRPIRQILDKRVVTSALSGDLWIRDVYTAHYFDSWGERIHIQCDPETHDIYVVHALLTDFDLMKKKDLLSLIARPRMKSAMRDLGFRYLDRSFEELKAQVGSTSAKSRPEMPSK